MALGHICAIYAGFGIIGLVPGWANTDTVVAKVMGIAFVLVGVVGLFATLTKRTNRDKNMYQ